MSLKEDIKILLIKSKMTMTDLAVAINNKHNRDYTVQNLNGKLTRGTLKFTEAQEIAEILGYEIKWVKKETKSKEEN